MTSGMHLLAFIGVVQLAAMPPGPDFVLVIRHAAVSGRQAGMAAAAGIAAGVFGWAVIAAFGARASRRSRVDRARCPRGWRSGTVC